MDTIRPNDVRIDASPIVYTRGREYALDGSVREIMFTKQGLRALVASATRRRPYRVRVFDQRGGNVDGACDCPYFKRTAAICKHVVATLLVWIDQRDGVRRVGPSQARRTDAAGGLQIRRAISVNPLDHSRDDRAHSFSPLEPWELADGIKSHVERWTWRVELDDGGPGLVVSGWARDGVREGDGPPPTAQYRLEARLVPTLLDLLHARANVSWSAPAQAVKLRRTSARLSLHVHYDATGDLLLSPHVHFPAAKTPARAIDSRDIVVDEENRTWVIDGLGYFPVSRDLDSPVDKVLAGTLPSRVSGAKIPGFLTNTLPALRANRSVRVSPIVRASRVLKNASLAEVHARTQRPARDSGAAPDGASAFANAGESQSGAEAWFWLDPVYRSGKYRVSLKDVIDAGESGWLRRGNDWIPVDRAAMLDEVAPVRLEAGESGVRVARTGLLRAQASWGGREIEFDADDDARAVIDRVASMKPLTPPPPLESLGMHGSLRHYQAIGYEWLWWLRESEFGGILADEMGLGKTHEVMALLLGVYAANPAPSRPSLVICPRSVLDHWEAKVTAYAPSLAPMIFHGLAREKDAAEIARHKLVVTTYGIVARSAAMLTGIDWEYVVLDEAQKIKNPETVTSRFARNLRARHRLAITGTPIENRAIELWSIMEFLIPGYLGTERDFERRFAKPIQLGDAERVDALKRAIRPFKLRRLKRDVLTELPKKVEDYRTCRLSPQQAAIYREILARRAAPLIDRLRSGSEPVDYIHIFAVLTLLKRLCDHPALVARGGKKSEMVSGKFEAFKELIEEIIEADEKVVVFSQYLEMLDLIEAHLNEKQIGFAKLRGSTVDRKGQLHKFQNDPQCRVFVGSLLAGGLGIDLTAASVVVHYDRWWNAARENQATDRVHRIGQSRGVQVWKLVTLGTIEERIDKMIREKGALMDAVVEADESSTLKALSRDELLELLAPAT
ncbi:MAG: SNF2-related protein [bacterium]